MHDKELLHTLRAALASHARLRLRAEDLDIRLEDGDVVLEGSVPDIASRRLVPAIVSQAGNGIGVVDRLHLQRDEPRNDADMTEDILQRMSQEPVFSGFRMLPGVAESDVKSRESGGEAADTQYSVWVQASDGVVRLSGTVESLSHRRMAEGLAWWTAGTRDVDNRLYVSPAEQDSDDEIADALLLLLEKDPWIDAGHVGIHVAERVVTLSGTLPGKEQKKMAENDAWYIAGVRDVINRITTAEWERQDECADEASRESFPASDPPAMTPVTGVGRRTRPRVTG